jgi:hypothetical protein
MHIQATKLFESITKVKGLKLNDHQKVNLKLACLKAVIDNERNSDQQQAAKVYLDIILTNPDASNKIIF